MARLAALEDLDAYRALVDAADDVVLIADWKTARFVEANQAAVDRLGYSRVELSKMTGGDLSDLPREAHRRFSAELTATGQTQVRDLPVRCRDGRRVRMDLWVRRFEIDGVAFHANVLRESDGPSPGSEAVQIARSRLLESEAFYRGVVTCTQDAVVVTQFEDGAFVEANPAACEMFRYSSVAWADIGCDDLFSAPGDETCVTLRRDLAERGSAELIDVELVRADGTRFYGDLRQNVFDNGGRRLIISIVRDVSERRRQREEVERAQRLAAVGEIAASIAHEVNNPAAYMLLNQTALDDASRRGERFVAAVRRLADAESDPSRRAALEACLALAPDAEAMGEAARDNRDGLERIRAVTDDLKRFSRREAVEVVVEDVNLAVTQSLGLMRNELRHRAELAVSLVEDLPTIHAERGKLGQVVTNLLVNASQAIVEGRASRNCVSVSTERHGEELCIAVVDTGVGMSTDTLTRARDPFFTTRAQDGGTGLGLSLCEDILRRHGGRLEVSSELGRGTRVEAWLPVDTGLALSSVPSSPRPKRRGRHMLVIDDDMGMVRAYRRLLGGRATVVSSGREALERLAREPRAYDLILCDLMMPDVDGVEVYLRLRASAPHLAKSMVFCTGAAFTARAQAFLAEIDNVVLDKPVDCEILFSLLEEDG